MRKDNCRNMTVANIHYICSSQNDCGFTCVFFFFFFYTSYISLSHPHPLLMLRGWVEVPCCAVTVSRSAFCWSLNASLSIPCLCSASSTTPRVSHHYGNSVHISHSHTPASISVHHFIKCVVHTYANRNSTKIIHMLREPHAHLESGALRSLLGFRSTTIITCNGRKRVSSAAGLSLGHRSSIKICRYSAINIKRYNAGL